MLSRVSAFRWRSVRLEAALVGAQARLDRAVASGRDEVRTRLCQGFLEQARSALGSGGVWSADSREFFAWDCMAQFDRQMLYLVDDQELASLWPSLVAEAQEKCSGHRKKAVAEIVKQVETAGLTRSAVEAVMQHLQTRSQNQYYKISRLRGQLSWAGLSLLALILAVLVASSRKAFDAFGPSLDQMLGLGTLLGWVGGVLSVALTVTSTDEKAKIPELMSSFQVSLVRPLIGAALALPVILVVSSGLITLGKIDPQWVVAIACFMAGFSERWFLSVLTGLETKATPASGKEPPSGR
jgi:hypothetical protein